MPQFHPDVYGPEFERLLNGNRRRPLDAGSPVASARDSIESLSLQRAFAPIRIVDGEMASCCLAGVWLLHDYLDESHAISQSIDTSSGSYWHAIMHRREGDFSNAKYWFRRVGDHPVIDLLGERSGRFHDPLAFVDSCEAVVTGRGDNRDACLDIQQLEWELLFDYCYRSAIGK